MGYVKMAAFTLFSYFPVALIAAIPVLIAGFMRKKKGKNPKKLFIAAGILLGMFFVWLIILFVIALVGVGPGRFDL